MAISSGRPRIWRPENSTSDLPTAWALYRITEHAGAIHYIGITSNLRRRTGEHRRSGNFNPSIHHLQYQVAAQGVHWRELQAWEQRKIQQHAPPGVTYIGGNGRPPAIQVNGEVIDIAPGESAEDAIERHGLLERFVRLFR